MWDSCTIIDALQKTEGRWELIEPFLDEAEAGNLEIVVSEISVVEVRNLRKMTAQGSEPEQIAAMVRDWFDSPFIIRRNVHPGISELAAEIGRVHKIKRAADAVVVATAVYESIPVLHTFDGWGNKKKAGLLRLDEKIGDPPLRIVVPNPAEGTLFDKT